MWRAFFLAIGAFLLILGAESLVVDKVVVKVPQKKQESGLPAAMDITGGRRTRDVVPPDWAPWSLMSAGAVTMLYSFTLPQRVKG